MSRQEEGDPDRSSPAVLGYVVFGVALLVQLFLVTRNFDQQFLIGHEFRQTQTALIANYIDKNNDFSLEYETPLFGPPWRMPLEVPIYQWCVVGVMRLTDWPDVVSARVVTLVSFYGLLVALYLLLGHTGLNRPERLLILAVVLLTPMYLFYARSVMIDPMATMFSGWFLAAFVELMTRRLWRWWMVATLMGTAAGLLKSVVFVVWVIPGAIFGAWSLWRSWREEGWPAAGKTATWGLSVMLLPVVAMKWWVGKTDAVKEGNPMIEVFTSYNLGFENFGTLDFGARFSAEVWSAILNCCQVGVNYPWILGIIWAGMLGVCKGMRSRIGGALVLFGLPPMIAPYAYGGQDYYFYACGVFAAVATGYGLVWVARQAHWAWAAKLVVILMPFVGQMVAFNSYHFPQQKVVSAGGSHLTGIVRDLFPEESVLMVQGSDWSAAWAYYSQRRTLMIRRGMHVNEPYMTAAVLALESEQVDGLVVDPELPFKETWASQMADRLGLNPWPTLWESRYELYLSPRMEEKVRSVYGDLDSPGLRVLPVPELQPGVALKSMEAITEESAAARFPLIDAPVTGHHFEYGTILSNLEGVQVMGFHPVAEVWLADRLNWGSLRVKFGIMPAAYEREGDGTTGVSFTLAAVRTDGTKREIWRRELRPHREESDQGTQVVEIDVSLSSGERLVFYSQPLESYSFDWAYLEAMSWRDS